MDLNNKNILVCGMARSGIAAAVLLANKGANVTLCDSKPKEQLTDAIAELEKSGAKVNMLVGQNPENTHQYDMLVLSPGVPYVLPFIQNAKAAGVPVISEVELAYRFTPCKIAAITGTNGKTTTTALTAQIIGAHIQNTHALGNIGTSWSGMVDSLSADSFVVAELSSFQLEVIDEFRPLVSAVLNISEDHLDRHGTMEYYIAAKERIFENQSSANFTVLNYDDPVCKSMANRTKARVLWFSSSKELEEGAYLKNGSIWLKFNGFYGALANINELKILGTHNMENAIAAALIAACAGVPADVISAQLKAFGGVEHRMEHVADINGVAYYNDSKATNTDAAIRAINSTNRPIVLIGGGYDKAANFDDWTKQFNGKVKHLVVFGQTADKIIDSAKNQGFTSFEKVKTLEEAVQNARKTAQEGDCVLLSPACASWDMFKDFEQRGELFKSQVLSALMNN